MRCIVRLSNSVDVSHIFTFIHWDIFLPLKSEKRSVEMKTLNQFDIYSIVNRFIVLLLLSLRILTMQKMFRVRYHHFWHFGSKWLHSIFWRLYTFLNCKNKKEEKKSHISTWNWNYWTMTWNWRVNRPFSIDLTTTFGAKLFIARKFVAICSPYGDTFFHILINPTNQLFKNAFLVPPGTTWPAQKILMSESYKYMKNLRFKFVVKWLSANYCSILFCVKSSAERCIKMTLLA